MGKRRGVYRIWMEKPEGMRRNIIIIIQGEHKFFPLITNIYYKKTTWNKNIYISFKM